jgi:hypothetical protein
MGFLVSKKSGSVKPEAAVPPTAKQIKLEPEDPFFPEQYVSAEGKVYRLLDDNFGLLRVHDNLVLFDVCDFWVDATATAAKKGLKIGEIVGLGSPVVFHASRLGGKLEKVQYLASSVWHPTIKEFEHSCPKSITKNEIHNDKVMIFKQVVVSVATSLPFFGGRIPANHVLYSKVGVVETLFVDENESFIAGVMSVGDVGEESNGKTRCAFLVEHFKSTGGSKVTVGYNFKCNIRRVVRKLDWTDKVSYLALSVYPSFNEAPVEEAGRASEKYEAGMKKFGEIYRIVKFTNRGCPFDGRSSKTTFTVRPKEAKGGTARFDLETFDEENENKNERISVGQFKCLTSSTTGLLVDLRKPTILCYFELEDLLGKEEKRKVKTIDLVRIMCNMAGIKICYRAEKMDCAKIGYAAHENGITVDVASGKRLPSQLAFLERRTKADKDAMRPTSEVSKFLNNLVLLISIEILEKQFFFFHFSYLSSGSRSTEALP